MATLFSKEEVEAEFEELTEERPIFGLAAGDEPLRIRVRVKIPWLAALE